MNLAITSIQRDRAPYLLEWLAFHMVVGVDRFFLYAHRCTDGTHELLVRLARHYPITPYLIEHDQQPQIAAYQHAWQAHGQGVGWMAFIDGDEFLMPTQDETLGAALAHYTEVPVSALGVHWVCYGSSGHLEEPAGLIMEHFTRHSAPGFLPNRHVKSIVRGGEPGVVIERSHLFQTPRGTVDDRLRPLNHGLSPHPEPCYERLRINHYVTQSYGYFESFKQHSGAADINPALVRPDSWFTEHDRNDCDDGIRWRFLLRLKLKLRELRSHLA